MIHIREFMEIHQLNQQGFNISAISRMTGRDRKTVRKYLRDKDKAPKAKSRKPKASKIKEYEEDILYYLNLSETETPPSTVIYEKLVEKGYTGSLSLIQKWVKNLQDKQLRKAVVRFETPPGKQAQVDWGEKRIKDRRTGLVKKAHIFGMTLGYSRMRFVHFVPKADMVHFLMCHKLAFEYFGGIPEEILYDQNRCVLKKTGFKDIVYNEKFLDFAHHYGFHPRVCKPYRAQTKGKVENLVKYVKTNFLLIQQTNDIRVLNQRKRKWLEKVNQKVHQTTHEIPLKRLKEELLTPFDSISDYEVCYAESRKVFRDSTLSFHSKRYSVPPSYIGKIVTVKHRPGQDRIDIFFRNQRITQHRTDTFEQYVIKKSHRHQIWKVWRNDMKLYYIKANKDKKEKKGNHQLELYEDVISWEVESAKRYG